MSQLFKSFFWIENWLNIKKVMSKDVLCLVIQFLVQVFGF